MAMLLFIAMPIFSVVTQSLFTPHDQVFKIVENCGPFGCKEVTSVDTEANALLRQEKPLGQWAGLDIYLDRGHLAVNEVADAWRTSDGLGEFLASIQNLPFYRAMSFTLTYTFVVTPLLIILAS